MIRIILLILAGFALLWMTLPQIHWQGTEIGFAPGSPDPNVYKSTYLLGWPLPWISWERSWNESAGYDETAFGSLHVSNLAIHMLAILAPLLIFYWFSRSGRRNAGTCCQRE